MKVLVIGNESSLTKHITFCLGMRYSDLEVVVAEDSGGGIRLVETESPDQVFLVPPFPSADCSSVIGDIRGFSDVGLILITPPEDTALERAEYLEAGADDCIAKPLNPLDFLGRVNALMRRIDGSGFDRERIFALGDSLVMNFATREVLVSGNSVKLTPTEYRLLFELVRNAGRVLTHHLLLEKVWSPEYTNDTALVKKYIYRLRHKIEENPDEPKLVLSERGVGYRLARRA